jgi:hypothetical protein
VRASAHAVMTAGVAAAGAGIEAMPCDKPQRQHCAAAADAPGPAAPAEHAPRSSQRARNTPTKAARKAAAAAQVAPVSDAAAAAGCCAHFLPRKRRYCSWPVKAGHAYCGQHLWQHGGPAEPRVPCPANPNQCVCVAECCVL